MINRSAIILPLVVLLLSSTFSSQTLPGGRLSGLSTPDQQSREQEKRNDRDLDRRLNTMRDLERTAQVQTNRMSGAGYREPTFTAAAKERVREMRKVNVADLDQYSAFLKLENTGIFKLFPNFDCLTHDLVRVDGACANFVPMSSDFSFRQRAYIDSQYADLQFNGDELRSTAFFTQGVLSTLGDVPIESVSLDGVYEVAKIAPAKNVGDATATAADLRKMADATGRKLSSRVKPELNQTYALRVIAYKVANSFPPVSVNTPDIQLRFMSLAFDKRSDEIIVFRIIRQDDIGGLTIVWKRLQKNEAPRIKFSKEEPFKDFHSEK